MARRCPASLGGLEHPSAADERVLRSLKAKELGAEIDGLRGALSTTRARRLQCVGVSLFLMSAKSTTRIWTAVTTGRWNFCFQFRKPVSSCFNSIWRFIAEWRPVRYLPMGPCVEVLVAIGLAPLIETNLRAHADLFVTSSDACESGAGITAVAGLSTSGVLAARGLPSELPGPAMRGCTLVSLFGGIEAGRRALDLLGVRPLRHLSVEIDRAATRNTQEVSPDAIITDDIRTFAEEAAKNTLVGSKAK